MLIILRTAKLLVNEDDDIILEQIRIIQSFLY